MSSNVKVILIVTCTICLCTIMGVGTEMLAVLWKVPDMNTPLSNAFVHVVDTLVGALIGMLIKTGADKMLPPDEPISTTIHQPANEPIPVTTDTHASHSEAATEERT